MSVNTGPSEETTIKVRVSTQFLDRIDELYEVQLYVGRRSPHRRHREYFFWLC